MLCTRPKFTMSVGFSFGSTRSERPATFDRRGTRAASRRGRRRRPAHHRVGRGDELALGVEELGVVEREERALTEAGLTVEQRGDAAADDAHRHTLLPSPQAHVDAVADALVQALQGVRPERDLPRAKRRSAREDRRDDRPTRKVEGHDADHAIVDAELSERPDRVRRHRRVAVEHGRSIRQQVGLAERGVARVPGLAEQPRGGDKVLQTGAKRQRRRDRRDRHRGGRQRGLHRNRGAPPPRLEASRAPVTVVIGKPAPESAAATLDTRRLPSSSRRRVLARSGRAPATAPRAWWPPGRGRGRSRRGAGRGGARRYGPDRPA